jgi:hypothetical protein
MMIAGSLLSIWVFVCSWIITDASTSPASWNFHVAGGMAILLSIVALTRFDDLAPYAIVAVGAWLILSPWLLNLPELVSKQTIFYGVILGCIGWFGRPSYKSRSDATST